MPVQKDVHILTSRICECVILHGKSDFADVLKDSEMERFISDYVGRHNIITSLYKREAGGPERDTGVMMEAGVM